MMDLIVDPYIIVYFYWPYINGIFSSGNISAACINIFLAIVTTVLWSGLSHYFGAR